MSDEHDNLKIVEILKKDILEYLLPEGDKITFTDDNTISDIEEYLLSFFDKDGLIIDFGARVTEDNYKKFVQIWVILIIMNERALPKNANNERRLNHLILVALEKFDPPAPKDNVTLRETINLKIINILIEDTLNYLQQNEKKQLIAPRPIEPKESFEDYRLYLKTYLSNGIISFDVDDKGEKKFNIMPNELKNELQMADDAGLPGRRFARDKKIKIKTDNGGIIYNIYEYVMKLTTRNVSGNENYQKFLQIFLILFFINERALQHSHNCRLDDDKKIPLYGIKYVGPKIFGKCVSDYYELNKTALTQLINKYLTKIVTVKGASDSFTVTDPAGGNFTHKTSRRYRKSIHKTKRRQRKTKRKTNRRKTKHH